MPAPIIARAEGQCYGREWSSERDVVADVNCTGETWSRFGASAMHALAPDSLPCEARGPPLRALSLLPSRLLLLDALFRSHPFFLLLLLHLGLRILHRPLGLLLFGLHLGRELDRAVGSTAPGRGQGGGRDDRE